MGDKAGADAGVPAAASGDKPADKPQPASGAGGAEARPPESAAKVADAPQPDTASNVTEAQPDTATKVADTPQPEAAATAVPEPAQPASAEQEKQSSTQAAGPSEPDKTQEEPAKVKGDGNEPTPKEEKSTEEPTDTGATKVAKENAQPKDAPVPAESSAAAEPAKSEPLAQPEASLPANETDTKVSDIEAAKSDAEGAGKTAPEGSAAEKSAPVEAEKPTETVVQEAAAAPESPVPAGETAKASEEKLGAVADESKPDSEQASETTVKALDSAVSPASGKGEDMEAIEKPAAGNQETSIASEQAGGKPDQATSAPSTAAKELQVPTPTNVSPAPSPSQSTPQDSASQPGVKPIPPPASLNQKPAPAGHTPGFLQNAPSALKGSATPWANLPKPEAPPKAGPVQMVGSHEDSSDVVAESSEEYRKQFSERKKFFKQQMEQQDTLPIKVAPPPASYKQQAPAAQPEPVVPVVLSQPKVPEALRLPINTEQDASPGTGVLRSTGSPYSPAAMAAAAEQEPQSAPVVERPAPPPLQPKQPTFGPSSEYFPGQTAPFTTLPPAGLTSPMGAPTPYHTPSTETPPMWSPPQGPISTPSQSGAQVSPGIGHSLPSFEAPRRINQWAPGNSALDQPSVPVPFGQQKPPAALPPFAQQSPTVRTPSPTFNLQQQQQKPQLAMSHNQFSSPQPGMAGYIPPGYAPQPAATAPYAAQPFSAGQTSHAPLPDLTDFIGPTGAMHKKKTFVDSSFYSENQELYPTFEEQVKLCRDISSSLTSDDNKQSLGARMFVRRKVKSKKWIADAAHHGVNGDKWESADESDMENEPPKPAGPPPMKYYMSPKGVDDAQSLMLKDPGTKIFDSISPISLAAVSQGLEHSAGRGVDLFQKRKQKSEEWVVDETNVKKAAPMLVIDNAPNKQSILNSPSVLYVKSPWEAALESPYGSCENAFQSVRLGDRANTNPPILTSRTPSPHVGAPAFHTTASPVPPPNDNFSRLPRGWAPASGSPAPAFEPAPVFHPPLPSPKPTPPVFQPAPEPMPAFRPQFNQPPPTPAPVHSVYRAAPPMAADYPSMNDNVALDADIPNYQQAPQSVARRYSQPAVELANVNFYSSPTPQQPPWLSQPSQDFYRPAAGGDRHVTWDPKVKKADHWAPQSTDEFRRMYNQKHQMWERPPEPMSQRTSHSRSRSQPPAPYAPGQQRGYQPSYNTYAAQPARKWGDKMSNWRPAPQVVPGMTPSFRPQSPVSPRPSSGSWGADMNSWKPRFAAAQQQPSFNRPQPKPASPSRPGSWGPDMHSWTPRPQAPAPQPTYRPQQQQRPGSWGPDMHNWTPRQQAPRFPPQQQTQTPPWGSAGQQPSRPSFAPASSGRFGGQPQQYAQPQQFAQPQQYGTLPRASPGASQWGGNRGGGLLVSDM